MSVASTGDVEQADDRARALVPGHNRPGSRNQVDLALFATAIVGLGQFFLAFFHLAAKTNEYVMLDHRSFNGDRAKGSLINVRFHLPSPQSVLGVLCLKMTAPSPGFPGDHHRVIIRSETNPCHLPTGTSQGNIAPPLSWQPMLSVMSFGFSSITLSGFSDSPFVGPYLLFALAFIVGYCLYALLRSWRAALCLHRPRFPGGAVARG